MSANEILTLILSFVAVVAAILKGMQIILRNLLISEGVIRPRRAGEPASDNWPNGYRNLPETLDGIMSRLPK